jgi:hypothetical protein
MASRSVPFQRPLPLISFSYNYVHPPPLADADLRRGYERWIRRPEERGWTKESDIQRVGQQVRHTVAFSFAARVIASPYTYYDEIHSYI